MYVCLSAVDSAVNKKVESFCRILDYLSLLLSYSPFPN